MEGSEYCMENVEIADASNRVCKGCKFWKMANEIQESGFKQNSAQVDLFKDDNGRVIWGCWDVNDNGKCIAQGVDKEEIKRRGMWYAERNGHIVTFGMAFIPRTKNDF